MNHPLTIYKASAGSGKTFALTVEYICLMLCSTRRSLWDSELTLAVTFTNKATAEMKSRIMETLYGLSAGLRESEGYMSAIRQRLEENGTPMDRETVSRRAAWALHLILHEYSLFRVETIDSFFQSVLRNLAHELGLNANLQVELNTDEVVSLAVDRVIDHIQEDRNLERWVLDYVEEQMLNEEKWNISGQVKSFARCIFGEEFQKRSAAERQLLNDTGRIRDLKRKLHAIRTDAATWAGKEAERIREIIEQGELNWERISNGRYYRSYLEKAALLEEVEPSATIRKALDDPALMLRAKDRTDTALLSQAREVAEELSVYADKCRGAQREYISATLALKYLNPLRLLGRIEEEVRSIHAENYQFSLSQTPLLLSKLLEQTDAPFVYEKVGTRFCHVMIDEFQDTSRLQWENFRVLLMENQAHGGSSLLVGDIKQSIYRWRGGEWEILKNMREEMKRLQPKELSLTRNYRSRQQVVDFNNAFFPRAAALLDSIAPGSRFKIADIYADVEQQCKEHDGSGYIYAHLYPRRGNRMPENYAERTVMDMAERIRALLNEGLDISRIAILVRNNRSTAELLRLFHLHAPDIRLVSDEAFLLKSSVAVQMIIAALRVLYDKAGNDPIPERYLMLHYVQDVEHRHADMHAIATAQPSDILPREWQESKEELRQLPLYLLCEKLYQVLNLQEIKGQDAYIHTLLDEVQNHLRTNLADIPSLLEAWEASIQNKSIPGGEMPGIRILTIHKSKGLQYQTVLLPYTDWGIEDEKNEHLLWCNTDVKPYGELGKLPIRSGSKMQQSVFEADYTEEHLQRRVDALNILYVAFTRAECNLMIWGCADSRKALPSTAGDIVYQCLDMGEAEEEWIYEAGTPVAGEARREAEEERNRLRFSHREEDACLSAVNSYPPPMNFMQSNLSKHFLSDLSQTEEELPPTPLTYIEIGKLMHYVLSQIEYEDEVESVLQRCFHEGLLPDRQSMAHVLQRVKKGLEDQTVRSWFSREMEVYNECSIASYSTETEMADVKRPDRVVMTEDRIIIIDFKFGKACAAYQEQVRHYAEILSRMYPNKTVEAWLWYIYSGQKENVCIIEKNS